MRVVFTCGGTAGHINPALAVAKLIKARRPSSEILFIGAEGGMETDLVPREGFPIETVRIASFSRSFKPSAIKHNISMLFMRRESVRRSRKMLLEFNPDIVVGTGGFASYPAVTAAAALGIPTAIHESNMKPGLTTSILSRNAKKIMVGFPSADKFYKHPERVVVTGTPVREDFLFKSRAAAKRELGLDSAPLVLSYWGSLGAREMNKMIARFIKLEVSEAARFNHIHSTGSFGWKWMPDLLRKKGINLEGTRVDMREYVYNMPTVMSAADIVICRGGASTLSEVLASATPAIIVPSPNVAENHQEANARALEKEGGAVVILESETTGERLYSEVSVLLEDKERLEKMSDSLRKMAILDSAERIYEVIKALVDKGITG